MAPVARPIRTWGIPVNSDIRIDTGFPHSQKLITLQKVLGPLAAWHLVCLWCWTALNRPTGDLTGLTERTIESAAQWNGEDGMLVATLKCYRWLDPTASGKLLIHDWKKHQAYACNAPRRQLAAKIGARHRWKPKHDNDLMRPASKPLDAPAPAPAPIPTPDLLPGFSVSEEPRKTDLLENQSSVRRSGRNGTYSPGFLRAWAAYPHFRDRSKKAKAWKVWKSAHLDAQAPQIEAWAIYVSDTEGRRDGGQYVSGFHRWLEGRPFDEDPPELRIADVATGKFARTLEALDRFVSKGRNHE